MREAWGCDGPTACDEAAAVIECPVCNSRPIECSHCQNTGKVTYRRCPWQLIEWCHAEVVMAALRFESGVLPAPGGFYDQASTFVDVFDVARNHLGKWREILQKRAEKKR